MAEIGIKLTYVMWRKFAPKEIAKADDKYNDIVFNLIDIRQYAIAETLAKFGIETVKKYHGEERVRRMMIINLANALRLQKRDKEAKDILAKEDWSAVGLDFQICVAAVREDLVKTVALMKKIGKSDIIKKEYYRQWPVFRGVRAKPEFVKAFEEIFGESVIVSKNIEEGEALKEDLGKPSLLH